MTRELHGMDASAAASAVAFPTVQAPCCMASNNDKRRAAVCIQVVCACVCACARARVCVCVCVRTRICVHARVHTRAHLHACCTCEEATDGFTGKQKVGMWGVDTEETGCSEAQNINASKCVREARYEHVPLSTFLPVVC